MLHDARSRGPLARTRYLSIINYTMLAAVLGLTTAVALHWILTNPHISGWDQLQYVEVSLRDFLVRRLDGAGGLRDALFNHYRWAPPGSRLLALPLLLLHATSETDFRLYSLALFILAAVLTFDACRRLADAAIAAGCTTVTLAAPVWVLASENFMSETALAPALALVLWCLVRESKERPPLYLPLLTGLAIGFAMLARFSFAPTAVVVVGMLTYRAWRSGALGRLCFTLLVACVLAWPFYAYDGVRYLAYARFAAKWPLDQMPSHGHLDYTLKYLRLLTVWVFGAAIVLMPVAIVTALRSLQRGHRLPAMRAPLSQRRFVGFGCGLMLLLTVLPHIFGHNQNPRYLVGALPLLSLFLASAIGPALAAALGTASALQAAAMAAIMLFGHGTAPSGTVFDHDGFVSVSRRENITCDYASLVHAVPASVRQPKVEFFGVSGVINHVQIELAFIRAGVLASVEPADLAAAAHADPTRTDADLVLVARQANDEESNSFVADPNRNLGSIRDRFLHDARFTLAPVNVGGPAQQCTMDVFLPRRG